MILTKDEIYRLTGYKRPSRQIEWLKKYGVRFMVAADGYPRVLRRELETSGNQAVRKPNLEALQRLS